MKVSVDQGRCQGNALCSAIAPEIFALRGDDKAYVTVDAVPDRTQAKVRSAMSSCPEQAITITT